MPIYTGQDIVNRSLRSIGVLASEESATAAQQSDALDSLNDLLHEWGARGIGPGHQDVGPSDELILDAEEYRALRLALAVELLTEYQQPPMPLLIAQADDSLRLLEARYSNPATLCADDIGPSHPVYDILRDAH
jgi:hypothetical protein